MRVVIADDHRVVREGLRWMLEPEPGIDVVAEVASGEELLQRLSDGLKVDVILLDIRLSGMSGFEVLEILSTDDARTLILSAHDDPEFVRRALDLGASGYLLKNVGQSELVRAMNLCLRGEIYIQGDLSGDLLRYVSSGESASRGLSKREVEMLQLIADGAANKQIAPALGISEATVKWHLKNVFAKLGVASRAEAVAEALRRELIH